MLFSYRITPQSTTGLSPAEMLQGRKLRSTLDQIHPERRTRVERKQSIQKKYHDKQVAGRNFQEGDAVITRNFSHGPKWIPGIITTITGPVSYKVRLGGGIIVRRHVDQILARPEDRVLMESRMWEPPELPGLPSAMVAGAKNSISEGNSCVPEENSPEAAEPALEPLEHALEKPALTLLMDNPSPSRQPPQQIAPVRKSQRRVCKPSYLKDYVC